MRFTYHIILTFGLLSAFANVQAANYYVDQNIDGSCNTYSPATRDCSGGHARAFHQFSGVIEKTRPGDTVFIRQGVYKNPLRPQVSGVKGKVITYKNYNGEKAVITGEHRPAIDLTNREYIVIEGLEVDNVARWFYLVNANHNLLKNNKFYKAWNKGGGSKIGIFFSNAKYNRVTGNHFEGNAGDALSIISSDRNIVEDNIFRFARHALWVIRCGNFNVIRNNYFHNKRQKIGEVYDCHKTAGYKRYNATKRNLIEGNDFAFVPSSGNSSPYSGIQYAGQDGIIRFNQFHDLTGPGIRFALYGREARHNTGNRTYHNVFYATQFAGVTIAPGPNMEDNIFVNNIFAKSKFVANDRRWQWWVHWVEGRPVQVMAARLNGFAFNNNSFFANEPGEAWLITHGWRKPGFRSGQIDIAEWESEYPELVNNTVKNDPEFVNAEKRDFRLSNKSPLIDRGAFLTQTTRSGSGTVIPVKDVSYFYDGFGIPGEQGDLVQLQGQQETARIVSIDYENKSLTLEKPLSWEEGQGLSLQYNGKAPDIGMFESGE